MNPVSVLLVDDSSSFLCFLTSFLEKCCYDEVVVVGIARSGEEALAQAPDLQPQVILVDLHMPGLSGLEVIPRLREMLPEAGIIALTLLDLDPYRHAALEVGADCFVSKSTLSIHLLPAIQQVVKIGQVGKSNKMGTITPERQNQ